MTARRERAPAPPADVEIIAAARAERLRFGRKPRAEASFEAGPEGESDVWTERENLPDEVEPGVTYRDVRIRWRGAAWIAAAARRPRRD